MEIQLEFQRITHGNPLEIQLKFNRNCNGIPMEIHWKSSKILMKSQWKSIGSPVEIQ